MAVVLPDPEFGIITHTREVLTAPHLNLVCSCSHLIQAVHLTIQKSPKKVPMLPVMAAPRSPLLIRSFISHNENTDSHDGSDTAMFSEQNKLYKSVPNQPGYYMNQEPLEVNSERPVHVRHTV